MTQSVKTTIVAFATLALFGSLTALSSGRVKPHTVTPGTITPFQIMIPIHIAAGHNTGGANGSTTGTQAFTVPVSQALTIETVSAYRTDPPLPPGSYDAIAAYVQTSIGGNRVSFVGPDVVRDDEPTSPAAGVSGGLKIYSDPSSVVIVNGFRNTTSTPYETMYVEISGYLTQQ